MRIEGAIFDLDGTLTDSMYIWNEAPKALVRKFGGKPPEDLARDIREMGRREASEYMVGYILPPLYARTGDGRGERPGDRGIPGQGPHEDGGGHTAGAAGSPGVPAASPPPARPFRHGTPWSVWGCGSTSCSPSVPFSTGLRPDRTSIGLLPAAWAARRSARWSLRMPSMPARSAKRAGFLVAGV